MSGSDKADPLDSRDGRTPAVAAKKVPQRGGSAKPAEVGRALRSVYDDTLREEIPSDLQDLLGRLG